MKVLHLPTNIASQISISVRALHELGLDAKGLARRTSAMQDYSGVQTVDWSGKPRPLRRLLRGMEWRLKLVRAMAWADVIHWHWGESTWRGIDLRLAAWLGKPRLVEFWGSDLRAPALASKDNPFLAQVYKDHPHLVHEQSSSSSQSRFARCGFECLIPGHELSDYLDQRFFAGYYATRACLLLSDFTPRWPEVAKPRPLVVHAPSNKAKKGTDLVLEAIARLSRTHAFDFKLIHQLPRSEALELMAQSDLFLDQFAIGAEGLASYEAMAFGKPVICFIKPALLPRYPAELPIVVADPATLPSTLASLLEDGARRRELGRRGRKYVEDYHDARKVCAGLIRVYRELYSKARGTARSAVGVESSEWRPLADVVEVPG